jgi:hypothetical protein
VALLYIEMLETRIVEGKIKEVSRVIRAFTPQKRNAKWFNN